MVDFAGRAWMLPFGDIQEWNISATTRLTAVCPFLRLHGGHDPLASASISIQRNLVFRSKGNLAKQIGWYILAFCVITCIVNSINCVWVAVACLLVPDFIYNIGTTILNGGISMVIFFFVNKVIFPEGEAKQV